MEGEMPPQESHGCKQCFVRLKRLPELTMLGKTALFQEMSTLLLKENSADKRTMLFKNDLPRLEMDFSIVSNCSDLKETFKCTYCSMTFDIHQSLSLHILSAHKRLQNDQHGQLSSHHQANVDNLLPTKCSHCEESFDSNYKLTKHILAVHQELRNFKCSHCDKTFCSESNLSRHVLVAHEGVKPFKCFLCEASFTKKGHLSQHVLSVHERVKPCKCSHCEKEFCSVRLYAWAVIYQYKLIYSFPIHVLTIRISKIKYNLSG